MRKTMERWSEGTELELLGEKRKPTVNVLIIGKSLVAPSPGISRKRESIVGLKCF